MSTHLSGDYAAIWTPFANGTTKQDTMRVLRDWVCESLRTAQTNGTPADDVRRSILFELISLKDAITGPLSVLHAQQYPTEASEGGSFIYHIGMDETRRYYYDVTANSEDEAAAKLIAYAHEGEYEDDVEQVAKDDEWTRDAVSIGDAVDVTCENCGASVEGDEDTHKCH